MTTFRDLTVLLIVVLLASPRIHVARSQSEATIEDPSAVSEEANDLGFVGDEPQDLSDNNLSPAPGVETAYVFPKNSARLVTAGEETELLVGLKNDGENVINIIGITASIRLPYDHNLLVQNLTSQKFSNAIVPANVQATFPYIFAVSPYLQPGTFDLEAAIVYEIEQQSFQSTFFNETIEVVDAGGFLTMETVLLVTFGIALLVLLGLWIQSQIQNLSKKSKKVSKVEVGTDSVDASMDEWLQGTAFANKAKKKNK